MIQDIVSLQREIYQAFADQVRAFAEAAIAFAVTMMAGVALASVAAATVLFRQQVMHLI